MTAATIVFLVACAAIAYIVAGYPLLAAWLARRSVRPVRTDTQARPVSVLIPVHNGALFLAAKLKSILALDYPRELLQILVVSDGSTDSTDEIARSFADRGVRLIRIPKGGKPAALNAGISEATNEILVLTDVRQELAPDSLKYLIAGFADPQVGVISGDLIVRRGDHEESVVGLYWRYERFLRKQLGRIESTFSATGPFYAMRRELAVRIPPGTLLDDMYLPLAAFFRGYRLIVEERARAFDYPTTLQTEFGRKVRTLAGNYQILRQYPQLLGPRNRMWFHFMSYKLARLLLPWLMLLLAAASMGLPPLWSLLALASQGLFYALAALDSWIPAGSMLKRITAAPGTVASLLVATVVALQVFLVQPEDLWKPTRVRLDRR
jgi:cellulose synthase/poly-beta-1,6-N-acetylglucosamine synthase-like glycosyltransferase